jgi:hypothetical protein
MKCGVRNALAPAKVFYADGRCDRHGLLNIPTQNGRDPKILIVNNFIFNDIKVPILIMLDRI